MSKKFLKNPSIATSRQLTDHNPNKITDIKQLSSPYKKTPISNTKTTLNSKNSLPNSNIKQTQEDSEVPDEQLIAKTKSKIKQESHPTSVNQQKIAKKTVSPVPSSQNLKKFSKTSKIPTLRSTTAKGTSDDSQSQCLKNIDSNMFAQESLAQTSSINNMTEQSQIAVSVLKSEVEVLKSQKEDLKKQNEKLAKKLQKLRSLNDQNKKLLKERIETFNSEGENLRKLKDEISQRQNSIEKLKEKVLSLEDQNRFLKNNLEKINTPKISREIQTIILQATEQHNEEDKIKNIIQQLNPQMQKLTQQINANNLMKKYETSSSRKSYGGILPLQTVVKLNASKFKINFRATEITPKKNQVEQQKLMEKYENYWSQKFGKQPRKCINQDENDKAFQAKSQYMANIKKFVSCEKESNKDDSMDLEMETVNEKKNHHHQQLMNEQHHINYLNENNQLKVQQNIERKEQQVKRSKRQNYRKQLQGRIQSLRYVSGQTQYVQQMQYQKQAFSPTILIENYRKISQQEELVKSLYRVIQELSKEIQIIQKRQDGLIQQNRELKIKFKKLTLEKETIQKKSLQKFIVPYSSDQQVLEQLKDDTLLLDQSKEDKNQKKQKSKKPKLTSAQRINQLLIFQNYEPLPSAEKPQNYQQLCRVQSAYDLYVDQTKIIDEISRFCHSQVLCHDSFDSFMKSDTKENNSFEKMEQMQEKSQDNKSSTKQEEAFKNMDDLDRKILAGTFEYIQFRGIVNGVGQIDKKEQNFQVEPDEIKSDEKGKKLSWVYQNNSSNENDEERFIQRVHFEMRGMQQPEGQPQMRIEDSLDVLQYFSDDTPENIDISQNVSGFNQAFHRVSRTEGSEQNGQVNEVDPLKMSEDLRELRDMKLNNSVELINVLGESLIRVEESNASGLYNIQKL